MRLTDLPIRLVPRFFSFSSICSSEIIKATDLAGGVTSAIRSFDHNLLYMGCRAHEDRWDRAKAIWGATNRRLILYESRFWVFVLQVTGIDWQPSGILTRGLDSLRGAMPLRQAIGWWRRSSSLFFYASSPLAHHSSASLMRPEGTQKWAAEGVLGFTILLSTRPRLCLTPVQRQPIHPDNAPTTHLTAVCCEARQSYSPGSSP